MDKILNRVCKIENHPISLLDKRYAVEYIQGLGSALCSILKDSQVAKMFYNVWAQSILTDNEDYASYYWVEDHKAIKKALSLKRKGWNLFTMRRSFLFDVYCLFYQSLIYGYDFNSVYSFFSKKYCGLFSKKILKDIHSFFTTRQNLSEKIGQSQLDHKNIYDTFLKKEVKKILVVATVSAGKSTLINALTGHFFNKVMTGVCTTRICKIHNKPTDDGITFRKNDLLFYDVDVNSHNSDDSAEVGIHFESTLGIHKLCLIDTPGVNNSSNLEHMRITSDAITSQNYDLIIFVSNGQYNGTNDERQLLNLLHKNTNKPIFFILNQLDRFKIGEDDIKKMIKEYKKELISIGFKSPKIFPLSAQYAYLIRMENTLDDDEIEDLKALKKRFSNKFLDLQKYEGKDSCNELEKSGIVSLENNIIQQLIH